MDNKLLTIIIPAYNMQEYLSRCVDSLTTAIDKLDIIIVNDGSTDDTIKIANKYQKKYPKSITVVNKGNAGHGSAINAGVALAKGNFLRVLDADDWFDNKDLPEYLENLAKTSADLVVTEYSRNSLKESERVSFTEFKPATILELDELLKLPAKEQVAFAAIHSITVRTKKYQKATPLLEKTFYEDQEFVAKALLVSENFVFYPLNIYQYFIARAGQSISPDKQFAHREDHARVLQKLTELYADCNDDVKKELTKRRIQETIKTHYWIYYYNSKTNKRREYRALLKTLKPQIKDIEAEIKPTFRLRLFIGRNKNKIIRRNHGQI